MPCASLRRREEEGADALLGELVVGGEAGDLDGGVGVELVVGDQQLLDGGEVAGGAQRQRGLRLRGASGDRRSARGQDFVVGSFV